MTLYSTFRKIAKRFSGMGLRKKVPLINKIYTAVNVRLVPKSVKVFDHIMLLDDQDSMGLAIRGNYENLETDLVRKIIKPGDVVVDVGANIGYFTLIFAQLVGIEGKVLAFEPDEKLFQILTANIQNNGYQNVALFNQGLSDQNSEAFLYLDEFNNLDNRIYASSSTAAKVEIKLVRLDDLIADYAPEVDLIKIDIQGAETFAFIGMRDCLRNSPNLKIITEFWPWSLIQAGSQPDEFLQILFEEGFSFFDIKHSLEHPVSIAWLMEKFPSSHNAATNLFCTRL